MYVCMYACMHVCMYVRIGTYVHTCRAHFNMYMPKIYVDIRGADMFSLRRGGWGHDFFTRHDRHAHAARHEGLMRW